MNILYEDDHIIVCEKPAGLPTQAGKVTDKDMVSELNNYLGKAVYLIHRLDKPVRGILVFAKTKQAASGLNSQMQSDVFKKKYYALVEKRPDKNSDMLENYMYKDGSQNKSVIVSEDDVESVIKAGKDVKLAKLIYKVLEPTITHMVTTQMVSMQSSDSQYEYALLDITLLTGRFHQIRCQLANIGCPICGDSLYGSTVRMKNRKAIGLTAYSLEFNHPITKKHLDFKISL